MVHINEISSLCFGNTEIYLVWSGTGWDRMAGFREDRLKCRGVWSCGDACSDEQLPSFEGRSCAVGKQPS